MVVLTSQSPIMAGAKSDSHGTYQRASMLEAAAILG
jgi:hypothetical protein